MKAPEIEITEPVLRTLLREQHPDLADLEIRRAARGWDNELWRLGDDLALRMPRTERAPGLLRKEYRWLPAMAPGLPLPAPTPLRLGVPSARFPEPWTVAAWVPGTPADRTPVSRGGRAADALGEFLRTLHAPAPVTAPPHQGRGGPLPPLAHDFTARLADLSPEDLGVGPDDAGALRALWQDAVAAPAWQGPPTWLHCDLHPANVVVTDGALTGVLDFGELCAGDPATDLGAAWLLLPEGSAPRFFEAYGRADEAMVRRAKGWAALQSLALIEVGRNGERGLPGGKVTWGHAGRATLQRLTAR
ncbi:aminoglycoside phosphotransferase family protein [Streptomyces sp. NPDC020607]|uniref:aminoglycoside phosphotransferase family protein n=1 Tax=Streptomyces sp. NPDC020607 TaxID=3365082 RepID=UPI003791E8C9